MTPSPPQVAVATEPYWTIYAKVYRDHRLASRKSPDPELRRFASAVLDALGRAHIVYLPSDQVDAIPATASSYQEEVRVLAALRAPFDVTFLAVGGMHEYDTHVGWKDTPIYAALIHGDEVIPFFHSPATTVGMGSAQMRVEGGGVPTRTWANFMADLPTDSTEHDTLLDEAMDMIVGGATKAMRSLFLLESANVDIADGASAPSGHRACGRPCHEVIISQRRRRNTGEGEPAGQDWSHRWEVRGHFKHFTSGVMFDGHEDRQIRNADGDLSVRIWCPPHIKGPEGKPLIPKARVLRQGSPA